MTTDKNSQAAKTAIRQLPDQKTPDIEQGATLDALLEKHNQAQHTPLPTWTDQAKNAIRQGQSLNDFILHCHPHSRKEARRAYMRLIVASVNNATALAEALRDLRTRVVAERPDCLNTTKADEALARWEAK